MIPPPTTPPMPKPTPNILPLNRIAATAVVVPKDDAPIPKTLTPIKAAMPANPNPAETAKDLMNPFSYSVKSKLYKLSTPCFAQDFASSKKSLSADSSFFIKIS